MVHDKSSMYPLRNMQKCLQRNTCTLFWSVSWSLWTLLSKTGRWRKHSSNLCFPCLRKIYPSNTFCTSLPRHRLFCFPVVSGYRISQCRFAHFSAGAFSQIARIYMPYPRPRCWEKAPLWNSFCLEYRGITASQMLTLVFLRPFLLLHWLASNSIFFHRMLLWLIL